MSLSQRHSRSVSCVLHLASALRLRLASCVYVRGVHGSVSVVFSQIYHRTDKNWLPHNHNRCTLPRVSFPTYSGSVFCSWFYWFKY